MMAEFTTYCKRCRSQRLVNYKTNMLRRFYRCMECGKLSSKELEGLKMANPRKGMVAYTIWLTKAEEESMIESLKDLEIDMYEQNITDIMAEANNRGDLEKR